MSTRACYIFEDKAEKYAVYKHHDGYPTSAAEAILKGRALAWPLPRFEPDEYAAAFVAANKPDAGGVRLLKGASLMDMSGDIEYLYIVRNISNNCMTARIQVTAYAVDFWQATTEAARHSAMTPLFTCPIEALEREAKEFEAKAA